MNPPSSWPTPWCSTPAADMRPALCATTTIPTATATVEVHAVPESKTGGLLLLAFAVVGVWRWLKR